MKTQSHTSPSSKLALTASYYLSFIMLGMVTAGEGPALPSLAENTASTLGQISLIFVFGALGYLLGVLAGGRSFDRLPGQRVIALTLLAFALCTALIPFMRELGLLLLDMFVLGIAKGVLDVGCNTLLFWSYGDKAGPFLNGLHFSYGLGAFGAPLVLALVLAFTGEFHWMFWLFALLSVPLAIWSWTLTASPGEASVERKKHMPVPLAPAAVIAVACLLYVGAEVGFGNWIYTYMLAVGLGDGLTSAYLTSAFWGTFTVSRLLGIWISARVRPAVTLSVDLLGCLTGLGIILLWPDSAAALWGGTIVLGMCMASIFPNILLLAGERLRVSGTMTSWFLAGASLGGMFLPWAIGQAFVSLGARAMPALVLGALGLNLLVLLLYRLLPDNRFKHA